MANGYVVPGFYAEIKDYQLSTLETAQSLKEDAIIFFGDLPDFVYVPDERSADVTAVKRVRIAPNTVLPVTNVDELIRTLTGENILDGILTQEQKDELLCRDMINVVKMSEALALEGKLALVKIVKRDGTRPDINNKFEVYQALENAYEKLGNVKCSQIVPIGIAGDDDFVNGDVKQPTVVIKQSEEKGAVKLDKVYNDIYHFSPVKNLADTKVEFVLAKPEVLVHTGSEPEQALIKKEGLASAKVKHLLKGQIKVNGKVKADNVQLAFVDGAFVADEEKNIEIVEGEVRLVVAKGAIFATVKIDAVNGKVVAKLGADGKAILNYYETDGVQAEVATVNSISGTAKVGDEIAITGKLKKAVDVFAATLSGDGFEVVENITLGEDHITFTGKVRPIEQGAKTFKLVVAEPFVPFTKEFSVKVSEGELNPSRKKAPKAVEVKAIDKMAVSGANQYVVVSVEKPTSNWIEVKNLGNLKEEVTKLAILEGKKDGVEQYTVTKSGTVVLEANELSEDKYEIVAVDLAEIVEPVHYEIKTKKADEGIVLAETQFLKWEGITFVLYEGLVIAPKEEADTESVYFDEKADKIGLAKFVVNYVPANSEPIMCSLRYVAEQVKTFSEVLMVWGTRPAESAEPNVAEKHVRKLVNLPKFKRGFKVRTSASKETDYGMFLSVVAGTIKKNGIGGISNFVSHRVIDYEREEGGIGAVKPMTNKVFIELTKEFYTGSNVEIKTYVGVKQKTIEAVVLSAKEVLGKTMLTLNKEIDTSVFSLDGFEVMLANTDTKDRHGSYAAAAFAIAANEERDRSPIQKDIDGIADFSFSQEALRLLLENKFTVITKNLITGKGTIVDTPLMTRKDSDYQSRSSIGTVLTLLNALRKVANEKKGKRFPKKEDKVMLEEDLRNVFIDELQRTESLITSYQFATDMRFLDTKGFLAVKFRVQDAKKLEVVEFAGGLAKL